MFYMGHKTLPEKSQISGAVILLALELQSLAFFCAPHCSTMLSSSSYHSQKSQQKSEEFLQGLCVFVCV